MAEKYKLYKRISMVFTMIIISVSANAYIDGPEALFAFADSLESSGDYYRAITEYRRLAFHWPEHPLAIESRYRIGRSYLLGNDSERAILEFQDLLTENLGEIDFFRARYALAKALFYSDKWLLAENQLKRLGSHIKLDPAIVYSRLWCYLKPGNIEAALSFWEDLPLQLTVDDLPSDMQPILHELQSLAALPKKNPRLSGVLSAIIPGLGQAYSGRSRNALTSFLLNGLFIGAIAVAIDQKHYETAAVIGFFELGFYSANIYNAVNDAHKINQSAYEEFLYRFETSNGPPFHRHDPSFNP
ncbi:MAG: tetratricopeptide repeat protein [bacterium]